MTSPMESAASVIAVEHLLTAIFLLIVGVPQAWAFLRHGWSLSDLQDFRLKTALVCCGFGLYMLWRSGIYVDVAFFDQRYIGNLLVRWPAELVISTLLLIASGYTAGLYYRYRSRHPHPEEAA